MYPSSRNALPLELIDIVIQNLHDDQATLRNCALVSRACSSFAQSLLFHDIDLDSYACVARLLAHLTCSPHLQKLIREVIIYQWGPQHQRPRHLHAPCAFEVYMTCLTAALSLCPRLVSVSVAFSDTKWAEEDNKAFIKLLRSHVLQKPSLVAIRIDGLRTVGNFQHLFAIFDGTGVKRVTLDSFHDDDDVGSITSTTVENLQLPSLEHIRVIFKTATALQERFAFWFCHPQTLLPNLKHFEIEMEHEIDLMYWCDVLRDGFRPLTSFRAEVTDDFDDFDDESEIYDDVGGQYLALPLNGLQFDHVIFSVKSREENYNGDVIIDFKKEQRFVEWWSATFRELVEHKATIHFTELTFTFSDFLHVEGISLAWRSLDNALGHAMFRGVRAVHFEHRDRRSCITESMCPALVQKIRLVMPKLSERDVLCFL